MSDTRVPLLIHTSYNLRRTSSIARFLPLLLSDTTRMTKTSQSGSTELTASTVWEKGLKESCRRCSTVRKKCEGGQSGKSCIRCTRLGVGPEECVFEPRAKAMNILDFVKREPEQDAHVPDDPPASVAGCASEAPSTILYSTPSYDYMTQGGEQPGGSLTPAPISYPTLYFPPAGEQRADQMGTLWTADGCGSWSVAVLGTTKVWSPDGFIRTYYPDNRLLEEDFIGTPPL